MGLLIASIRTVAMTKTRWRLAWRQNYTPVYLRRLRVLGDSNLLGLFVRDAKCMMPSTLIRIPES